MSEHHSRLELDLYEPAPVHDFDAESSAIDFAEETPKRKEYVSQGTFNKDGWGLEILSLLVSLTLFVGMVVIFYTMEDKALSKWPLPIDINTAIAILATGCTAAMMHNVSAFISQLKWLYFGNSPCQLYNIERFDEASRGPYGSAIFVFRTPWNMATIGAFITILRLGFAPFSQQVISLQPREVSIQDNTTTFGFAHAYNRYNPWAERAEIRPDAQMQSAILQGLYDINTIPLFNCSGLCRWNSSYVSLGFKSHCKNVTISTLETESCVVTMNGALTKCNLTTPGGITLTTRRWETEYRTEFRINTTTNRGFYSGDLYDLGEVARMAIYRSGSDNRNRAQNINITECTVDVAAYKYMGAQANGSTFAFGKVSEIDLRNASWNLTYLSNIYKVYALESDDPTLTNLPRLTIYPGDLYTLRAFFETIMFQSEYVYGNYDGENPGLSAALAGGVDIQGALDSMARSMTDYLRSGPNMQLATGFRIETEIFLLIRWRWLIGPGLLELAALLFAVCTIVGNARKRKVPLWKSSALVLLTCQHDADAGQINGEFRDVKELKKMAKASKAQLE